MDQKQVTEIVRQYKEAIQPIVEDARVYLYGSYSKGTAHKDSDIDVAVVVPRLKEGMDWWKVSSSLWGATWNINTLIEPVLMEDCHPSPLYEDVMQTGIAI
ncbi:MAG: nucleotidyltransferase domain-containing protein [Paludibacteraceae bacterium]|nr:nucleotidyltransferase domain-containing protein [Paludibacteraceae bacterium]